MAPRAGGGGGTVFAAYEDALRVSGALGATGKRRARAIAGVSDIRLESPRCRSESLKSPDHVGCENAFHPGERGVGSE